MGNTLLEIGIIVLLVLLNAGQPQVDENACCELLMARSGERRSCATE